MAVLCRLYRNAFSIINNHFVRHKKLIFVFIPLIDYMDENIITKISYTYQTNSRAIPQTHFMLSSLIISMYCNNSELCLLLPLTFSIYFQQSHFFLFLNTTQNECIARLIMIMTTTTIIIINTSRRQRESHFSL